MHVGQAEIASLEAVGELGVIETKLMQDLAGWPEAIARPGLPQTRTSAINASGSSV
jgi:hypothetical protein